MSTYYDFYVARKNKQGQFRIVGPAKYSKDGQFRFYPAASRSRSFIDWDEWCDIMRKVDISEIDPEETNFSIMALDYTWTDKANDFRSISYVCKYSDIVNLSEKGNAGLYIGYATLEDVYAVSRLNYYVEDYYDIHFFPADVVAEMQPEERAKYGKVAYRVTNSAAYIADKIISAVSNMFFDEENYYIICTIG